MDTIFIPVDFSNSSNAALRLGINLAVTMKKRLIICHVYSLSVADLSHLNTEKELDILINETEQKLIKQLLSLLAKISKRAGFPTIPVHARCLVSYNAQTAQTIVEQAANNKAKVIIIGTHGIGGFRKMLFGSTAASLIQRSTIPVLAVPAGCRKKNLRNICLASDLLQLREELKVLRPLAKNMEAAVNVLHLQYGRLNESLITDARKLLSQNSFNDISFSSKPADLAKKLIDQIQAELKKSGTDALVMFPHKKGFWDRLLLGSKTEDMAGILKIPLLSLKLH